MGNCCAPKGQEKSIKPENWLDNDLIPRLLHNKKESILIKDDDSGDRRKLRIPASLIGDARKSLEDKHNFETACVGELTMRYRHPITDKF